MNNFKSLFSLKKANPAYDDVSRNTTLRYFYNKREQALAFFLVGVLGLPIIASICQTFLSNLIEDNDLLLSVLLNFVPYVIITIGIILTVIFNKQLRRTVIVSTLIKLQSLILIVIMGMAINNLTGVLYQNIVGIFHPIEDNANQTAIVTMLKSNYSIMIIMMTTLMAPIVEEFTYRVGLMGLFKTKSQIWPIFISAIVFGFIHFDFFSKELLNEFLTLPIYIFSGLAFGYIYVRTESPTPSIILHAILNAISCIFIFLGPEAPVIEGVAFISHFASVI